MTQLHAATTRPCLVIESPRRGLATRLAAWITARADRARAEDMDRLGWDLEARHDRLAAARAERSFGPIVPPSLWPR